MSSSTKSIDIIWLYSRDMNIYGDYGNVLTIKRRLEWHGYEANVIEYNPGDNFPASADLIIGGGGQDSGQSKIQADLAKISPRLAKLAEDDTPMLMVCGLYQLLGKAFTPADGQSIKGIGIFDAETHAGSERLTGNIVIENDTFGQLIGYENHSGQTVLGKSAKSFGTVIKGAGNNGQDDTEGAIYKSTIGTYLHGPLLPKNPILADWLIEKAAMNRYGEFDPSVIDDRFATEARKAAAKRPR